MPGTSIVGTVDGIKDSFIVFEYTGAEGIGSIIGTNGVGLVFDNGVNLRSINIDVIVERLRDALIERVSKST